MRIAYVCRDLAIGTMTGPDAHVFAVAAAMARHGHEVHLISERLAAPWTRMLRNIVGLHWQPTLPEREGHWYFTDEQSYADRVYDTLRLLHEGSPLDVIDFLDAGGEGLTVLRAHRLLGQFHTSRIVVSRHPWASASDGPQVQRPATFHRELTTFAERYTRRHADLVLTCGGNATRLDTDHGGRVRAYPPALPDLDPGNRRIAWRASGTILWLGTLCPGAGIDTMMRAMELVVARIPDARLVLRGSDTPTDPVGRSYWRHTHARLSAELRRAVTFAGPMHPDAVREQSAMLCVLAAGSASTPADALWAMSVGCPLIVPDDSVGVGFVDDDRTGRIVAVRDADALAAAIIDAMLDAEAAARLGSAARAAVRTDHACAQIAESLTAAYHSASPPARLPTPTGLVSVVIPLYNYGRFLPAAVASVRESGYADVEIVVVDDGSTDPETAAVLDDMSGVTKIRQPNRGLSAARNTGIRSSRGDLVLVLDADDRIRPGFLSAAVAAMRSDDTLGYVGGYVRYSGLLDLVYVPAGMVPELNLVLHTHLKSMVLYRKRALDEVGGYDENLPAFEDWELQLRMDLSGYASDVLPIVGQLYRRHAESMSFQHSNGMRNELVQYLVSKHAGALTPARLTALLLILVDMWKTGYEPSTSVMLQREQHPADRLPDGVVAP
ncbi:glycosyltransferase [Nocardia sp. NPDC050713]|uniref:glycosyltransferase n=1 Tax=Nocardia sp. NPDC050713 TaxID=3154511 RepID=UPI003407394A